MKRNLPPSLLNQNSCASLTLIILSLLLSGCVRLNGTEAGSAQVKEAEGKAVVLSVKGQVEVRESSAGQAQDSAWQPLFDGKTLAGWKATDFAGSGEVEVQKGELVLNAGVMLTGVSWTNSLPKTNYEVSLEAMKKDGSDFFCGFTFPVGDSHCTFIVGGWGGGIVGISSIDSMDASENETTKYLNFEKNKWYRIRVRVTPKTIQAWIDDEQMVDQSIEDRRISMRPGEIELSAPFGVAAWQTTSALRNIRLRKIE
ncbi:MAG: DUF1080 domain-containing protein [Verrucomicrobia bacterium]|nr:DUF1080 domain-containing protein [Verrucomicrobiota bacterium]